MKKAILSFIIILSLIIVSLSGCISTDDDGDDEKDGKKGGEDKTRYFEFSGQVKDYDTGEPLEGVQVRLDVTWYYGYYTRTPPQPQSTKELGITTTTSNGSYYLKAPTYENNSADYIQFKLIFTKSKYFVQSRVVSDTGEKLMQYFYNISLYVCIELDGEITGAAGEPLDKAVIILNIAGNNKVPQPEIYHITTSMSNGKYYFNYLSSKYNFDIIIGCEGYQSKIIEDVHFDGHIQHLMNISLTPINYSMRNITVNGSLTSYDENPNDFFGNEVFFVWIFNIMDQTIEIVNVNETWNFTAIITPGSYYFTPFSSPDDYHSDWGFTSQPFGIDKDIELEIQIEIYLP
jgi:hypothetical protein